MNSKRQTIWLVSMLSLMVVLSAYYLFTEDVNNLDFNATGSKEPSAKEIVVNTNDLNGKQNSAATTPSDAKTGAASSEAKQPAAETAKPDSKASGTKTDAPSDAKANSNAKPDAQAKDQTASKSNEQVSPADAKVLQQVSAQAKSGTDYFINLSLKRNEEMSKQIEKWMAIQTDTKQTQEASAAAAAEIKKIQDNEAKITNLEDSLMKDFPQAVVMEEASKWKVTVQSNKLEKSQAVSIVDKVMQEMGVGPDKIVVQYIP